MKPDDRIRLQHMADALGHAMRFVQGRSRDDIESDAMLGFAIMYALQTVGEAASKISPETRAELPRVPWVDIIGMRHRLVHAYTDIDPDVVWRTVTEFAPDLLSKVDAILHEG